MTHGKQPVGIVAAMTAARTIGRAGELPWDLPADRLLFRQLTEGGCVIMGRRTFESLPAPLVNRTNIVLSRSGRHYPGAETCPSLLAGLALAWRSGRPVFVIGGEELYRKALPIADTLHISWVEGDYAGDRYFPAIDFSVWEIVRTTQYPGFRHVTYRRATPSL